MIHSGKVWDQLLPILYPRHCPVCSRTLSYGKLICSGCRDSLPWIREPVCFMCGKPVLSYEQELCYDCRSFPKSFHSGLSLLLYNEKTRPFIADFKYHNRRYLSRFFAEEIVLRYRNRINTGKIDLIIPVPVHKHKLRTRGYNQAALLAGELSRLTGIPSLHDLLIRVTDTIPQKQLTPQARLSNLQGAFSLNPRYKKPGNSRTRILLTDDIYTTGATMESCTRVLLAAGYRQVDICTICTGVARD